MQMIEHPGPGVTCTCPLCCPTKYRIGAATTRASVELVGVPICPDVLRYDQIGAADNLRGRVVRGFFWLLRWWG